MWSMPIIFPFRFIFLFIYLNYNKFSCGVGRFHLISWWMPFLPFSAERKGTTQGKKVKYFCKTQKTKSSTDSNQSAKWCYNQNFIIVILIFSIQIRINDKTFFTEEWGVMWLQIYIDHYFYHYLISHRENIIVECCT